MLPREEAMFPIAAHWIRPGRQGLMIVSLLLCALFFWIGSELLFNYGQLWRRAPIVETAYPAFSMPAGIPVTLMFLVAGLHALVKGRVMTANSGLWSKWINILGRIMLVLLFGLTPMLAIGTTIALKELDYRTCNELRVSGSAWQVFWVNTDAYYEAHRLVACKRTRMQCRHAKKPHSLLPHTGFGP